MSRADLLATGSTPAAVDSNEVELTQKRSYNRRVADASLRIAKDAAPRGAIEKLRNEVEVGTSRARYRRSATHQLIPMPVKVLGINGENDEVCRFMGLKVLKCRAL